MWILVVILFIGGDLADSKILSAKTESDCKEGRAEVQKRPVPEGMSLWMGECVEVQVPKFKKERDS